MKATMTLLFLFLYGYSFAQDRGKNIYSRHAWAERDKWQRPDELIRFLKITSGSQVADIGCHEGYMTFKLARAVGQKGVVYAVDVESAKLEKVRKHALENNLHHIKTIKGDHDNPGLPSNSLDAVIILDTYHEMDNHDEILEHIKNSLKTGGRLLICEPIADSRRGRSRSEQEKRHELALEYALADLKQAGFSIVYKKDNFIDRSKEKGDKMWVAVATK
jgi:ubiquinone/menaquinone biosynthesis C-methylase UbiE